MVKDLRINVDMILQKEEAERQVELFARDTKVKIDPIKKIKFEGDISDLQFDLAILRSNLSSLKKEPFINEAKIKTTQTAINNMSSELTEAKRRLQNLKNTGDETTSRLQKKFDGVTKGLSSVNSIIGTIGISISTYLSAQRVIELSDSFTNLNNRLKQVAEGKELDTLRDKIFKGANDARVGVEEYAAAFVRFDLVNRQLGGTQEETLTIIDSLAKGLSSSGAAASEVNAVMLQLAQAFGSGKLAGDEFRSVAENMPQLLDILSKSLGVPRGALKDLAAEGKITSEVLKGALIDANEQLNASFDKTSVTIGQAMTNATNKFIKKFGEMDKTYSITLKVTNAIGQLSDIMISGIGFVFKYMGAIKELIIALTILKGAQALIGVASILRTLPAIFGAATLSANLFAGANTILAGTLARLGIASTAALGPLGALVGAIYAAVLAYRQLKDAQSNRSSGQINAQNVRGQVADTATGTAREIQRIKAENTKLAKTNTVQGREQLKLNENNLKIEQQKLKTQNLILQKQTLVTQGKIAESDLLQSSINKEQQKLQSLRTELGLEQRVSDLKNQDVGLKIEELDTTKISSSGGGGAVKSAKSQSEEIKKIKEEEFKELERIANDSYDAQIDKNEDLRDSIQKNLDSLEEQKQAYIDLKKEGVSALQEINQELKALETEEDTSLAERRVNILEEQAKIEKDIADLKKNTEGSDEDRVKQNELIAEQKKLSEELLLIEQNADLGILKQVESYEKLSEAEKILFDQQEKRKKLQEEQLLQSAIANDREVTFTEDATGIKAFVEDEKGVLIELQDFKTAQKAKEYDLEREAIRTKTEGLIEQINTEYSLLQEADIQRRNLETQYSEFLKLESLKRITVTNDYIKKLREVQALQRATGVSIPTASTTQAQNTQTVQNTYNTTINANTSSAARTAVNDTFSILPQA